ncbi:BMP family protein [Bacillaceae bacterium S4-13-56]
MNLRRFLVVFALLLTMGLVLGACGTSDEENNGAANEGNNTTDNTGNENEGTNEGGDTATDFTVGMVTDVGGVDDKSFNQSAWEGLQEFGAEHGLEQGPNGFDYVQSGGDEDYAPNLNQLARQDFDLIYGIGYLLTAAVDEIALQFPDTNFAIVDSVVEQPNTTSILFKEHQGSFLVGVAAAMKTESNKVGFVGGVEGDLIKKFESGFRAGVKSVNPDIDIQVQYAESFNDSAKGKLIAADMYNGGIDVIYHASGGTGAGVFAEAKDRKKSDPDQNIWVIGVDRDQHEEGQIDDDNVTLTSMVKRVDVAVKDIAERTLNGDFPGGEIVEYGLEGNGVSVAQTNTEAMTQEIIDAVNDWQQKIIDGEVEVPSTREDADAFIEGL